MVLFVLRHDTSTSPNSLWKVYFYLLFGCKVFDCTCIIRDILLSCLLHLFLCFFLGLSSLIMSGFHQAALWLGLNRLRPQGLKEYSDDYLALDYLGPILGSKCLVMQAMGDYLGLGPSEETSERMFQVATRTFNLLYYFSFMYTHWSHFSG
jgi:hypothetical protein